MQVIAAEAENTVLRTYKRLLTLAKRLPASERNDALNQIRTGFRQGRSEKDDAKIKELIGNAQKKISYLRMVTPREPAENVGSKRYVMADGQFVEVGDAGRGAGVGKAARNDWLQGQLDPDALRRHEAAVRRMRFMDRPVMPRGPFGR